jgi:hypothetical protein
MFMTTVLERIKTRFLFNNFFLENRAFFLHNVEQLCRTRQATDNNMARAYCMLDI